MSFLWGAEVIIREQYAENMSRLWADYPNHPMSFIHKLYFIIQLSYYLHMLPELYFQKVKKDEQLAKVKHSLAGTVIIGFFYFFAYRRIAIVLLTLHYFSEFVAHTFGLLEVFDKDEKYVKCELRNKSNDFFFLNHLLMFLFSPRLQQHHFPAHRLLHFGPLLPNILHRYRQDSLDARHDGTHRCFLNSGLPHLPLHHVLPQVKARVEGGVGKADQEGQGRCASRKERP